MGSTLFDLPNDSLTRTRYARSSTGAGLTTSRTAICSQLQISSKMKKRALSDSLCQHALNRADPAAHLAGNGTIAPALPVQFADLFLLLLANGGPTELDPMSLGSSNARFDAL